MQLLSFFRRWVAAICIAIHRQQAPDASSGAFADQAYTDTDHL